MQIVAIGGGEIKRRETLPLDELVVELTGRCHPRALFIPTASRDAEGYCDTFDRIYGGLLGCRTEHLLLHGRDRSPRVAAEKIAAADLIYVGGGNTLMMMTLWRRLGVDRALRSAGRRGAVLAGLSAGAICWHEWGHSDSRSFTRERGWSYIRVKGLGFVRGTFCPHLDAERRRAPFSRMMLRRGGCGIGCDNRAAIWYSHGQAVAKTASSAARVCLFVRRAGRIDVSTMRDGDLLPL